MDSHKTNKARTFWYPQFSQKTNEKNWLYYYGASSQIVFIRYLGELKTWKIHFKVKWPLVSTFCTKIIFILFFHKVFNTFQKVFKKCSIFFFVFSPMEFTANYLKSTLDCDNKNLFKLPRRYLLKTKLLLVFPLIFLIACKLARDP